MMTNRFFPEKKIYNAHVARPISARVFAWLAVTAVAGALLSSGFVISARQHFEAISVGYESENLRRQSLELEEKLRQLDLEYARVTSPVEIERRARQMGLQQPDAKATSAAPKPEPKSEKIRRPTNASPRARR